MQSKNLSQFNFNGKEAPKGYGYRNGRLCIDSPFFDYQETLRFIVKCIDQDKLTDFNSDYAAYAQKLEHNGVVFSSPGNSPKRWVCYAYLHNFGIDVFVDEDSKFLLEYECTRDFVYRSSSLLIETFLKNCRVHSAHNN
jgi:hypothetical protein